MATYNGKLEECRVRFADFDARERNTGIERLKDRPEELESFLVDFDKKIQERGPIEEFARIWWDAHQRVVHAEKEYRRLEKENLTLKDVTPFPGDDLPQ